MSAAPTPFVFADFQTARDTLLASIRAGDRYVLFTGESGAGKTTLLRAIRGQLDRSFARIVYFNLARLSPAGLVRVLARQLRVPPSRSQPETVQALVKVLHDEPVRTWLWIDEAQLLPDDTFAELRTLVEADLAGLAVGAGIEFMEMQRRDSGAATQRGDGAAHVEADRGGPAGLVDAAPARAGIDQAVRAAGIIGGQGTLLWRRCRLGDIAPGAGAGVGQAEPGQTVEGGAVGGQADRLKQHRLLPCDTEPSQFAGDPVDEFGARAAQVEILDSEQELATRRLGRAPADEGREGMAEMQLAGRAGREPINIPAGVH